MSTPKKSIMDKLKDVEKKSQQDAGFATTFSDLAVAAIIGGVTSQAWKDYMEKIVGPHAPKQLARLTLQDSASGDPYVRRSAIYIVSNSVCGPGTTNPTGMRVNATIDAGLPLEPSE